MTKPKHHPNPPSSRGAGKKTARRKSSTGRFVSVSRKRKPQTRVIASARAGEGPTRAASTGELIGYAFADRTELISRIHQGFDYDSFVYLQTLLELPGKELAEILKIPSRTLSRRKERGTLDPTESERIFRIADLYNRAEAVLEGRERALRWLKSPQRALAQHTPLEYADTEPGAQEVRDLLGRIEEGVYS